MKSFRSSDILQKWLLWLLLFVWHPDDHISIGPAPRIRAVHYHTSRKSMFVYNALSESFVHKKSTICTNVHTCRLSGKGWNNHYNNLSPTCRRTATQHRITLLCPLIASSPSLIYGLHRSPFHFYTIRLARIPPESNIGAPLSLQKLSITLPSLTAPFVLNITFILFSSLIGLGFHHLFIWVQRYDTSAECSCWQYMCQLCQSDRNRILAYTDSHWQVTGSVDDWKARCQRILCSAPNLTNSLWFGVSTIGMMCLSSVISCDVLH